MNHSCLNLHWYGLRRCVMTCPGDGYLRTFRRITYYVQCCIYACSPLTHGVETQPPLAGRRGIEATAIVDNLQRNGAAPRLKAIYVSVLRSHVQDNRNMMSFRVLED